MIKCKVCESGLVPSIDAHYVARDNGESGFATMIKSTEGKLYDAFDCPICGCQIIAQERKRVYVQPNEVATDIVLCDDCENKGKDSWCEPVENIDGFYCARGKHKDGECDDEDEVDK